jgi:hypothetical protein
MYSKGCCSATAPPSAAALTGRIWSSGCKEIRAWIREAALYGALAILEIGLDRMRAECPHFNDWLTRLEGQVRRA